MLRFRSAPSRAPRFAAAPGQVQRPAIPRGACLRPHSAAPRRCPYVRLAFAHPPAEALEEGVRRLGAVLRQAQAERQQQHAGA